MVMSDFQKRFVNREKRGHRNLELTRGFLDRQPPGAIQDVLELGCGIGTVSARLADEYGFKVAGTDVDPDQIERARAKYGGRRNLHYQVEDASRLSFDGDSFDVIIAQNMLHHVGDWQMAAGEMARVLRPGGHVLLLEPVFGKVIGALFALLGHHEHIPPIEEVIEVFGRAGLDVKEHQYLRRAFVSGNSLIFRRPE